MSKEINADGIKTLKRIYTWLISYFLCLLFLRGVCQSLPLNSKNAVLYGISKHFETSNFHTKQRCSNLTAKTDPPAFLTTAKVHCLRKKSELGLLRAGLLASIGVQTYYHKRKPGEFSIPPPDFFLLISQKKSLQPQTFCSNYFSTTIKAIGSITSARLLILKDILHMWAISKTRWFWFIKRNNFSKKKIIFVPRTFRLLPTRSFTSCSLNQQHEIISAQIK